MNELKEMLEATSECINEMFDKIIDKWIWLITAEWLKNKGNHWVGWKQFLPSRPYKPKH